MELENSMLIDGKDPIEKVDEMWWDQVHSRLWAFAQLGEKAPV